MIEFIKRILTFAVVLTIICLNMAYASDVLIPTYNLNKIKVDAYGFATRPVRDFNKKPEPVISITKDDEKIIQFGDITFVEPDNFSKNIISENQIQYIGIDYDDNVALLVQREKIGIFNAEKFALLFLQAMNIDEYKDFKLDILENKYEYKAYTYSADDVFCAIAFVNHKDFAYVFASITAETDNYENNVELSLNNLNLILDTVKFN